MRLILKYIKNNIFEKKVRVFLIVFAVTLSTAALFSAQSITDSIKITFESMIRFKVGNSDLIVNKSNELFKYNEDIEKISSEYRVKELNLVGISEKDLGKKVAVNLIGVNYGDLEKHNKQQLFQDIESLNDDEIIISKKTADNNNISIGDKVGITIFGVEKTYKVIALSESAKLFVGESGYAVGVVSYKSLENIVGENLVSKIYVKAKDGKNLEELKAELKTIFPNETVENSVKENEVRIVTEMMSSCFAMVMMLIMFMSIFIIYSSVKIMMKERLSVIGTFRSVGATNKNIFCAFVLESFIYGIVGGVIGNIVGIGVFKFIAEITNPYKTSGAAAQIVIEPKYLIMAFIIAVVTTVLSAVVPIYKTTKIPIKNIILQVEDKFTKNSIPRLVFSIISILTCAFFMDKLPEKNGFIIGCVIVICTMISFILISPYVIAVIVKILNKTIGKILGKDSVVSVWNLRGNKTLINNMTIIMISIAIVTMVYQCLSSSQKQLSSSYEYYKYDIAVMSNYGDDNLLNKLLELKDVETAYGILRSEEVTVKEKDIVIKRLDGIDNTNYLDYVDIGIPKAKENIKKLKEGKNILIGDILSKALGVKVGDTITLKSSIGESEYKIIDIFNTNYILSGHYAIISKNNFIKDIGNDKYNEIWLKVNGNITGVMDKIRSEYVDKNPIVATKNEQEKDFTGFYKTVTDPMGYFAIIALVIGLFGILNNFAISFIERKKSFGVIRSVGMSIKQQKKMLIIEGVLLGTIGSIMAICLATLILPSVPIITEAMGAILLVINETRICAIFALIGIGISLIGSLINLKRVDDLNIIDTIKYE